MVLEVTNSLSQTGDTIFILSSTGQILAKSEWNQFSYLNVKPKYLSGLIDGVSSGATITNYKDHKEQKVNLRMARKSLVYVTKKNSADFSLASIREFWTKIPILGIELASFQDRKSRLKFLPLVHSH